MFYACDHSNIHYYLNAKHRRHTRSHTHYTLHTAFILRICYTYEVLMSKIPSVPPGQHENTERRGGWRKNIVYNALECLLAFGFCEFNYGQVFLAFSPSKCNDDTAQCLLHACFFLYMSIFDEDMRWTDEKPNPIVNLIICGGCRVVLLLTFRRTQCCPWNMRLFIYIKYAQLIWFIKCTTNWFHLKN